MSHSPPTIGISGYDPDFSCQNGPIVSLNRMVRSMQEQGRAIPRQASRWRNDLNIHVVQAPRWMRTPSILRVDGIAVDSGNTLGDTDSLNQKVFDSLKRVDGIFYISEFSRKLIEAFYGTPDKPSVVIHNSIDLERFSPKGPHYRQDLSWSEEDLVFVASAKWRRWKRLPETLEWFKQVKSSTDRRCRLLILGGGEHVETDDPDVHYAGAVSPEELPSWYRTADMFVHLATLEACGNTQIEAMGCGLPVLCTSNGGIRETVEKANGGIVSACDPVYTFTKVDHYNPQPPDYEILLEDTSRLILDLEGFRTRLDRTVLDIRKSATQLADFCDVILSGTASDEPPSCTAEM